ncbi:M23 family metallopeptidase [Streptomyces sp. CS159]|uniref:M23 family metallopeptidase n=1 Tax=Streptomyces sp. CS159 TaxID=1982762 RepID=UPI00118146D1|nr:M23 family metallopeptidase [Streptomyces sp. CS159]
MALALLTSALLLCLLVAVHRYLYRRLVKDVTVPGGRGRRLGAALVWLSAALTLLLLTAGPAEPSPGVRRIAERVAAVWPTLLLCLTVALLLGEAVRPLVRRLAARRAAPAPDASPREREGGAATGASAPRASDDDPARRLFVARTVAIGASALATGTASVVLARSGEPAGQDPRAQGVTIALPFTGPWRVRNSPARRVPSHGTSLLGSSHAIDFVAVDERHRTAGSRSWRTFLATEPPELFHAFGLPVLAPVDGRIVAAHDAEPDHEARRSQLALVPYMLGQGARLREGVRAIAGNHVIIALSPSGPFVALVHFKAGSVRVAVGDTVVVGQHIADCGNSGNSTQPHVHVQAMDSADLSVARGLPMRFPAYREWSRGPGGGFRVVEGTAPREESVVEPF